MDKNLYFTILEFLKEGKYPKQISEELGIKKQNISYYTRKLKEIGAIRKKGYGVWEVLISKREHLEHTLKLKNKKIRGHAFIWTVKLNKKYNWEEILNKNKIKYSLIRGYIPRVIIKTRKIWLGKKSIVVYEPHSFYGTNAIQSRKYATINLLEILKKLESKLKIDLGKRKIFKPAREHYGLIKNELARQYNKSGEKLIVHDDLEGDWLWIDDSHSLAELENGGKKAPLRSTQVQRWWNDNKKHNFQVTPTFVLEGINKVSENQLMFNKNFESHVKSIRQLGNSANANAQTTELLAGVVKDLMCEVKNLKNEIKNLKK